MRFKQLPKWQYLEECFIYDGVTGILYWNERPESHFKSADKCKLFNTRFCGNPAGSFLNNRGIYEKTVKINNKRFAAHRVIYAMVKRNDLLRNYMVIHLDQNRLNNRIENLILFHDNTRNRNMRMRNDNRTGCNGVCYIKSKKKYRAYVSCDHHFHHLGYFDNFEEAKAARLAANDRYGFLSNHGKKL